jgi:dolichyl-diphosphooligosaccharide--protein glycosyltransferase
MLAPAFSGLTALAAYLLAREVAGPGAGLFSALFLGLSTSYMSRSVAGGYDNEGVAIFALVLTCFCFVRGCRRGSLLWGALAGLSLFYMVASWGGYTFLINLLPLYVLGLLILGRLSAREYICYCAFYCVGTVAAMQVQFVSFLAVQSSEHLLSHAVFVILQLHGLHRWASQFEGYKRVTRVLPYVALCLFFALLATLQLLGLSKWS